MKILFLLLAFLSLNVQSQNSEVSKVYFTERLTPEALVEIFQFVKNELHGNIAFKTHFGEENNRNFISADLMKPLVLELDATFVETNVLYVSKRRYTESHIKLAKDHGFNYAPIDILDSKGDTIINVKTANFDKIHTGKNFFNYDSYVIFSHFKGHGSAGFGGAIKNISMGLASIHGKMAMHASDIPQVKPSKCISCGICVKECPVDAITLNPLKIDKDKCIGCAKCIGECPVEAFSIPWGSTSERVFLERLVEYAQVLSSQKKMVYVNVLANISRSCDCVRHTPKPFMEDIGILVSTDLVAIEKASHDLVDKKCNCDDAFVKAGNPSGKFQIEYAFDLKMGNINYQLINIDKK